MLKYICMTICRVLRCRKLSVVTVLTIWQFMRVNRLSAFSSASSLELFPHLMSRCDGSVLALIQLTRVNRLFMFSSVSLLLRLMPIPGISSTQLGIDSFPSKQQGVPVTLICFFFSSRTLWFCQPLMSFVYSFVGFCDGSSVSFPDTISFLLIVVI